jgi:hypothetical protein
MVPVATPSPADEAVTSRRPASDTGPDALNTPNSPDVSGRRTSGPASPAPTDGGSRLSLFGHPGPKHLPNWGDIAPSTDQPAGRSTWAVPAVRRVSATQLVATVPEVPVSTTLPWASPAPGRNWLPAV